MIIVALLVALIVAIVVSFLLPCIFWASNVGGFVAANEERFYEEVRLYDYEFGKETMSMIIPFNRSITKILDGHYYKTIK